MPPLKLAPLPGKTQAPEAIQSTSIYPGRRYTIENQDPAVLNSTHGVLGHYRITPTCAASIPITASTDLNACFFWDSDVELSNLTGRIRQSSTAQPLPLKDCRLKNNRLLLTGTSLSGPEVGIPNGQAVLTLTPRFEVTFATDSFPAQLGILHLVESTRFITLENGRQVVLLDTGQEPSPVLYLENRQDELPVKLLGSQQEIGIAREYSLSTSISQAIPDEIGNGAVATVTVLEQYHSYFMQCAAMPDASNSIWTPIFPPISWGWSIRVGRRPDSEWDIMRRKLVLPTTGHEGLELPCWSANSTDCSFSMKTGI